MNEENIKKALQILELPPFITQEEIKIQYKKLSKKFHPDLSKNNGEKMSQINQAYKILMDYIKNYRYSFDDEEIAKQLPHIHFNKKFKM